MGELVTLPQGRRAIVEVVVAVVLLVVLAAIVVPRHSAASDNSQLTVLLADLQTVRSRLEVYKAQHGGRYPDKDFMGQMLGCTNAAGETRDEPSPEFPLGPYLQTVPPNPFSGDAGVRTVDSPRVRFMPPQEDAGWWYNVATGDFRADLPDVRTLPNGLVLNRL